MRKVTDQFNEWWGKGKGSEQWAKTVDKDILGAIKVAFHAGVLSEKDRTAAPEMYEALKEASDYLNGNHGLNNIGARSPLHKKFMAAIAKAENKG